MDEKMVEWKAAAKAEEMAEWSVQSLAALLEYCLVVETEGKLEHQMVAWKVVEKEYLLVVKMVGSWAFVMAVGRAAWRAGQ
jgi:uracil DNA glycosylase